MNYLPILGAAVVNMVIGYLWYGPVFGKQWMKLVGMTEKDMQEGSKQGMGKAYFLAYVSSVVMAYGLSMFLSKTGASTVTQGLMVGFWAWVAFVATSGSMDYVFNAKKKPGNLYLLEQAYWLVVLLVNSWLLSVWR